MVYFISSKYDMAFRRAVSYAHCPWTVSYVCWHHRSEENYYVCSVCGYSQLPMNRIGCMIASQRSMLCALYTFFRLIMDNLHVSYSVKVQPISTDRTPNHPERPLKSQTAEIACNISELHALPPKLVGKRVYVDTHSCLWIASGVWWHRSGLCWEPPARRWMRMWPAPAARQVNCGQPRQTSDTSEVSGQTRQRSAVSG